jgi:hypothetical protein
MSWKHEKFHRAIESNNRYASLITTGIKGLPKAVLGGVAAEALYTAMAVATKHDSSRAAANWQLRKAGDPVETVLDPYYYGEQGTGAKGDAGAMRDFAINYKLMAYGITSGTEHTPIPGGVLAAKIGMGKGGHPPKLYLTNPIASENVGRPDGFGRSYEANAFGSSDWIEVKMEGVVNSVGERVMTNYLRHLMLGVKA